MARAAPTAMPTGTMCLLGEPTATRRALHASSAGLYHVHAAPRTSIAGRMLCPLVFLTVHPQVLKHLGNQQLRIAVAITTQELAAVSCNYSQHVSRSCCRCSRTSGHSLPGQLQSCSRSLPDSCQALPMQWDMGPARLPTPALEFPSFLITTGNASKTTKFIWGLNALARAASEAYSTARGQELAQLASGESQQWHAPRLAFNLVSRFVPPRQTHGKNMIVSSWATRSYLTTGPLAPPAIPDIGKVVLCCLVCPYCSCYVCRALLRPLASSSAVGGYTWSNKPAVYFTDLWAPCRIFVVTVFDVSCVCWLIWSGGAFGRCRIHGEP